MPIVPVSSHSLPTKQTPVFQATAFPYNPAEVRHTLAQEVQQQVSKTGTVSSDFLDRFAGSHLDKSAVDTPVSWDYVALRDTAKREEEKQQHQQQQQHTQQQQQKKQNIEQKQRYNKFNKDLKNGPHF